MTAKEVKAIRARLGMTQKQLADSVGVARVTVARWECGLVRVQEPTARLLRLLRRPKVAKTKTASQGSLF